MIIKQNLKEIDLLILTDVKQHPGSSFEAVTKRMLAYYRARSYIHTCIHRLVAQGHIQNTGGSHSSALYCVAIPTT
jgi:hypothetical protein